MAFATSELEHRSASPNQPEKRWRINHLIVAARYLGASHCQLDATSRFDDRRKGLFSVEDDSEPDSTIPPVAYLDPATVWERYRVSSRRMVHPPRRLVDCQVGGSDRWHGTYSALCLLPLSRSSQRLLQVAGEILWTQCPPAHRLMRRLMCYFSFTQQRDFQMPLIPRRLH